ncbi:MAG: hypothetical protein N2746_09685 [Deltaproteobacteria bacterium]|nr:hypothetical protein [Deltaproteobacteria bacterium]
MPSIMDLVREYSELEMRRNQRGGMLEPQAEIRYQALKFFLEFDLFPLPQIKSFEQMRVQERKKVVHSSEFKKPSDDKQDLQPLNAQKIDKPMEHAIVDSKAEDLASIISETSLPVSDLSSGKETASGAVSEINKGEQVVLPGELKVDTDSHLKKEDVLGMVEAIDEAMESIVIQSNEQKTSEIAELRTVDGAENINTDIKLSDVGLIDNEGLSTQANNVFENVIEPQEYGKTVDQVVVENILPEIPRSDDKTVNTEYSIDSKPSNFTERFEIESEPKYVVESPRVVKDEQHTDKMAQSYVDREELLVQNTTTQNQEEKKAEQLTINIEELIADLGNIPNGSSPPKQPDNGVNPLSIDFLSVFATGPQDLTASSTQQSLDDKVQPISLEEILPVDFAIPEQHKVAQIVDRVLIDSAVKAAIHTIDGDARRGIIRELRESSIEVELFADETYSHSTKIPTSEIKAIFILKQPSDKTIDISGQRISVKFKDERSISGISIDYTEDAKIFTLFPLEGTHSAKMIIVYRTFVEQVEKL